ncbi:hypothetical protein BH09DEP1_BH09DEP1_5110 [soil metagenome]
MNKQYGFALLIISSLISGNIKAQEAPHGQGSSHSNHRPSGTNSALETFAAVTLSEDLEELPSIFCESVINRLPETEKKRVNFLIDKQKKEEFRGHIILHGPTGSGKSTLAQVILQEIGRPFLIVSGSMIANEFQNSGASGIRRIRDFAIKEKRNLVIDEMDSVAQIKCKKNEYQREDEAPRALWDTLDGLRKKKLLLIGTTNDITGMPNQLQKRLKKYIFEIPYTDQTVLIKDLITSLLTSNNISLDDQQSKESLSKMFKKMAIRDINDILSLAIDNARIENGVDPVLTLADVMTAWQEIKKNEKLMEKTKWDKKETIIFACQIVGGLAAFAAILGVIYSVKHSSKSLEFAQKANTLASENKQIALDVLAHTKETTAKSFEFSQKANETASANKQIALDSLEHSKKAANQQYSFQLLNLLIALSGSES